MPVMLWVITTTGWKWLYKFKMNNCVFCPFFLCSSLEKKEEEVEEEEEEENML